MFPHKKTNNIIITITIPFIRRVGTKKRSVLTTTKRVSYIGIISPIKDTVIKILKSQTDRRIQTKIRKERHITKPPKSKITKEEKNIH